MVLKENTEGSSWRNMIGENLEEVSKHQLLEGVTEDWNLRPSPGIIQLTEGAKIMVGTESTILAAEKEIGLGFESDFKFFSFLFSFFQNFYKVSQ